MIATPRVVTGLWFSMEATVSPLGRVETLSGSDLTNSLSVLATAAWPYCLLAVLCTAGDFTIRDAMTRLVMVTTLARRLEAAVKEGSS